MKTRDIKELLTLLRDYVSSYYDGWGMCWSITEMYGEDIISFREKNRLDKYLDNNNPDRDQIWWWNRQEKRPRLKWLDEQIKKLSK